MHQRSATKPATTASFTMQEAFGIYRMTSLRNSVAGCAELGEDELASVREPFFVVAAPPWALGQTYLLTCAAVDDCKKKADGTIRRASRMVGFEKVNASGLIGTGAITFGAKKGGKCESDFMQHGIKPIEGGVRVELRTAHFEHPVGAGGACYSKQVLELGPEKPCTKLEVFLGQRVSAEASQSGSRE
jgi:hypothetical protein